MAADSALDLVFVDDDEDDDDDEVGAACFTLGGVLAAALRSTDVASFDGAFLALDNDDDEKDDDDDVDLETERVSVFLCDCCRWGRTGETDGIGGGGGANEWGSICCC